MLANELINYMIPALKPTDDIGKAQSWMDEFRLSQLPVIEDKIFLGIITEEMLFDSEIVFAEVGNYPLLGNKSTVNPLSHFYDVLKMANKDELKLVAVVDELDGYVGVIATEDVIEAFTKSSSIVNPGAVITLKLNAIDYSLSEISRVIESNEAKILTSYISEYPDDPSKILLTLKLNSEEISHIIASLGNQGFHIESSFGTIESIDIDKERLDVFMKFLKT